MDYQQLKDSISEVIKTNGNEEITGEVLQFILLEMVSSLGKDYQFAGVATPETVIAERDENVVYVVGAGTYTNLGEPFTVASNEIAFVMYNGTYEVQRVRTGIENVGITLEADKELVFVNESTTVTLTAHVAKESANIVISRGGVVLATGSGMELIAQDIIDMSDDGDVVYEVTADVDGVQRTAEKRVSAVYPVYYGAAENAEEILERATPRRSPEGTYEVAAAEGEHFFFLVPDGMTIKAVTMSGMVVPMEEPEQIEVGGAAYLKYRSVNAYQEETYILNVIGEDMGNNTYIPDRLRNMAVGGYVAGAEDIIDDDLQLTQAQINGIVLGGTINVSLSANKTAVFVGETTPVTLTATISTLADTIKIFKSGVSEPIATGSGTSLSFTDDVEPSERGTIRYYAEFKIGDFVKRAPASGFVSVQAVDKIYTGAGTTYGGAELVAETIPHAAGSFNKQITTAAGDYLFIEIPDNFNLTAIKLVSTYETSLSFTQIESTREGYKAYKNDEPRGAGSYTYRFTIANV